MWRRRGVARVQALSVVSVVSHVVWRGRAAAGEAEARRLRGRKGGRRGKPSWIGPSPSLHPLPHPPRTCDTRTTTNYCMNVKSWRVTRKGGGGRGRSCWLCGRTISCHVRRQRCVARRDESKLSVPLSSGLALGLDLAPAPCQAVRFRLPFCN